MIKLIILSVGAFVRWQFQGSKKVKYSDVAGDPHKHDSVFFKNFIIGLIVWILICFVVIALLKE